MLLIFILLALIYFLYNDIYVLGKIGFVVFVGVHLLLLFFVKVQYVSLFYDEENQKIKFHYNKQFGWNWSQKIRTVLLPMKQFDGYKIGMDSMGMSVITFYKLDKDDRYELGPFHVGFISNKERRRFKKLFGDAT